MKICVYRLNAKVLTALFLLWMIPFVSNAQGDLPCNDADPFDIACPLDTWVIVLVAAAGLFTAIHLHRKQKSLRA
jgi:hypothetical protein